MPIPLPDLPAQPRTAIDAPQMSAQAAAAPGAALGNLAQSLASVSQFFHNDAIRLQRIENARQISEARNNLGQQYADFQLSLQSEMDPAARLQKTREFLAAAQRALIPADAPPEVADQLTGHFETFATQAVIRQAEDSHNLTIRRAKQAAENELDAAVQTGRLDLAEQAIQTTAAWATPEEQDKIRKNVRRRIAGNQWQETIEADPLGAERELDDPDFLAQHPDLDREDLPRLQAAAAREANTMRSEFINAVTISGEPVTEDDLSTWRTEGLVDSDIHARWLSSLRTAAAKQPHQFDGKLYEQAHTAILAYDPARDPSGAALAQLRQAIASQPLPRESIAELNARLNEHLKPDDTKPPKHRLEADFSQKITSEFSQGAFGKYRFPVDHDKNPATAPIYPINRAAYDAAWKARMAFAEEWRRVLSTLPEEADFATVNSAYETLRKSYQDKKPVPAITPPAVPAAAAPLFNPDRTLNPTGGNFGGQPVMAPGAFYEGTAGTVFGGKNDPDDDGKSAFGGTTGPGGRSGVAIPKPILDQTFPGTSKQWRAENIMAVVTSPQGLTYPIPIADYGTAERVWDAKQRPVLDLTADYAKKLGGSILYDSKGRMIGTKGLETLSFAVVSTATAKPLAKLDTWEEAEDSWWAVNRAVSADAALASLAALRWKWDQLQGAFQPSAKPAKSTALPPATASLPVGDPSTVAPDLLLPP